MQVSGIQYNPFVQNRYKKPSFRGWERQVYKEISPRNPFITEISHRNNTSVFRNGREIPDMIDDAIDLFRWIPFVNTHIYGCSNGAESYSMLIYTDSKYGEKILSKFLPLRAKDFDAEAILRAKRKTLPITSDEFYRINNFTGGNFNKYFDGKRIGIYPNIDYKNYSGMSYISKIFDKEISTADSWIGGREVRLKEDYARLIQYDVANILDDYKTICPDEPSLVSARNFWPYLGLNNVRNLAKNLGKQMKKGSVLFVGDYDTSWLVNPLRKNPLDLVKLLKDNGFEPYGKTGLVFVKVT